MGHDSEPLHQAVREQLGATLLAPLNRRGHKGPVRQPGRRAAAQRLKTPAGQALWERRTAIDRWFGYFKGFSQLTALPPYIRHLDRVTICVMLKLVLFLQHQRLTGQERKVA